MTNQNTQLPAFPGARMPKVMISYSHDDRQWLDVLKKHLEALKPQLLIDFWDDSQILPGTRWRQAITDAINSVDFVLMLVSTNFLEDNFIAKYELPQILHRCSEGKLTMLSLLLSPSLFNESPLAQYQVLNPNNPLEMLSSSEQEQAFVDITRQIQKALQ